MWHVSVWPVLSPRIRRKRNRWLRGSKAGYRSTRISFISGATSKRLHWSIGCDFVPSVDVGIGDVTTVSGNFEFTYTFPGGRPWNLYVGGGPSINWYNFDNGSDNTEAGFNFLGGVKNQAGLFFEVKIGVEGSPDLKFGVGYTFR